MLTSSRQHALAPSSRHAPSYYAATVAERVAAPSLTDDANAHVCVVGGGFTGLSAALHLAKRGIEVILLEQSRLAWGASGRNGGQAHVGLRRDQEWLEKTVGAAHARKLWELALDARTHLDTLIARPSASIAIFAPGCCTPITSSAIRTTPAATSITCANATDTPGIRFVDRGGGARNGGHGYLLQRLVRCGRRTSASAELRPGARARRAGMRRAPARGVRSLGRGARGHRLADSHAHRAGAGESGDPGLQRLPARDRARGRTSRHADQQLHRASPNPWAKSAHARSSATASPCPTRASS